MQLFHIPQCFIQNSDVHISRIWSIVGYGTGLSWALWNWSALFTDAVQCYFIGTNSALVGFNTKWYSAIHVHVLYVDVTVWTRNMLILSFIHSRDRVCGKWKYEVLKSTKQNKATRSDAQSYMYQVSKFHDSPFCVIGLCVRHALVSLRLFSNVMTLHWHKVNVIKMSTLPK